MLGMLALSQLQFSGLHNEGDETCRAVWLVGTQLPASTVMTCVTLGKLLILLGSCVLSEKHGWWHLPFKGVAQITWNKAINHLARDLTMEKAVKETNHDDDPSLSKSEVRRWKEKNIYSNGKVSYKLHSVQSLSHVWLLPVCGFFNFHDLRLER